MKFRSKNTLAYFNAAPHTHQHDLSDLPTAVLATATKDYKLNCTQESPNDSAVSFYVLNHAAAIVRKKFTVNAPLPEWAQTIMQTYTDVCMAQGERMLHYLLCITTREMRHLKSCTPAFWTKVQNEFGQIGVDVLKNISSNGNEDTAMNKYMVTPPSMTIGEYTKLLAFAYHKAGGSGWQGSYGGQPWGLTTDALVSMLHGTTSLEMMVDTGYTLCHNGGPIFDKGMMYSHYDQNLLTALDVQHTGQMLDLMLETNTLHVKKTAEAIKVVELIKVHAPQELKGYVDWKLVDEARSDDSKNKYPSKYAQIVNAQQAKAPVVKKPVKVAKQPLTKVHGKKVKVTGTWQVFPHQVVTTYERLE